MASDTGGEPASETVRRPALVRLTRDHRELVESLLDGFESRRAILEWNQELTVRTLGEVPQDWYYDVARQFRVPPDGPQRTLMEVLLADSELDDGKARDFRARIGTTIIHPAFHAAFGALRADVTEYVGESGDPKHDPLKQRYIAMRPALDDLDRWQKEALESCLAGFEDTADLINWGEQLELATHGEIDGDLVPRCTRERSSYWLLTTQTPTARAGRELWVAYHLIPAFNRGARDLFGRSGEEAAEHRTPMEATQG